MSAAKNMKLQVLLWSWMFWGVYNFNSISLKRVLSASRIPVGFTVESRLKDLKHHDKIVNAAFRLFYGRVV